MYVRVSDGWLGFTALQYFIGDEHLKFLTIVITSHPRFMGICSKFMEIVTGLFAFFKYIWASARFGMSCLFAFVKYIWASARFGMS